MDQREKMGATGIAEQLAKMLPVQQVYTDLISPGAKQLGYAVEDVLKCIRLATFPIQVGSAAQDQLARFLRMAVDNVPEQRRVLPAPNILGPVIEGIRYEPEGSIAEQMFAELLSRSMDKDRRGEAHPAFPHLIKQLSHDEARIIKLIKTAKVQGRTYKKIIRNRLSDEKRFSVDSIEVDEFPKDELLFPANVDFYINHLWYLGLAGIFEYRNQEPLYNVASEDQEGEPRRQIGTREYREYRLTDLGTMLAGAVMR